MLPVVYSEPTVSYSMSTGLTVENMSIVPS